MTLPLIGPDQDFALWAVLIAIAAFGFWCERTSWGRKYSGAMLLITRVHPQARHAALEEAVGDMGNVYR